MSGDSAWGAQAFEWMVRHATPAPGGTKPSGAIIGAVPLDEPDDRIPAMEKAGSSPVTGLVVPETAGNDPKAEPVLRDAGVIFIRGGDQGRYVKGWRGTTTESAIRAAFARGATVGGTSAGCAVLGEVTYSAEKDSLTPPEALADAHHEDLTLVRGFLGFVPGVFFDTHFTERGRIGRFPVMLARSRGLFDDARDVLGAGVDPRTAVAVTPDGVASVMGEGTVTLLRLTEESAVSIPKGAAPTVTHVSYRQLLSGTTFRVSDGGVVSRPDSVQRNPHPEVVEETSFDGLTLDGGDASHGALGVLKIHREDEGVEPRWKLLTGDGRLPGSIVSTGVWGRGVWERIAMCQHALSAQPGMLAWWLGEGCRVVITSRGVATVAADSKASLVLLDSRGATHTGALVREDFRHRVHLEGAMLHVLGPGWGFNLRTRGVIPPETP